jgi:multisubunit Na+/H+ antiporter MnhE subunit
VARSVDLTFGPGVIQQDVMIMIIDDLRLEHDEQFNTFVSLTVADPAVSLSPGRASITIVDNDRELLIHPSTSNCKG